MKQLGKWSVINCDYCAQDDAEIGIAMFTRVCIVHECRGDIQEPIVPNSYDYPWLYGQTAEGACGFFPACITTRYRSNVSTFCNSELAFNAFNSRWRELGQPGTGVDQLGSYWGQGGNDVHPEIYSIWDTNDPAYDKEGQCSNCQGTMPRDSFSRHQWNCRSYKNRYKSFCSSCERAIQPSQVCTCTREYEVWEFCRTCLMRVDVVSLEAHTRASEKAAKLPHLQMVWDHTPW